MSTLQPCPNVELLHYLPYLPFEFLLPETAQKPAPDDASLIDKYGPRTVGYAVSPGDTVTFIKTDGPLDFLLLYVLGNFLFLVLYSYTDDRETFIPIFLACPLDQGDLFFTSPSPACKKVEDQRFSSKLCNPYLSTIEKFKAKFRCRSVYN